MTTNSMMRAAIIVFIAVLLAPPIGGLAFFLFRSIQLIALGEFDDPLGLAVIIALGTYVVGGPIAFVAGALLAAVAQWRMPTLPMVLCVVVIANLVVFLIQPTIGYGFGGFAINLGASLVSGAVCSWLFKRRLGARQ
jgi:hypothetical protein